ncbi:MAG: DNA-binding response regulator [Anaerolineae bacterium]|nr:MAG: DNA-binding response regulator [Anaerolineae bacterium]
MPVKVLVIDDDSAITELLGLLLKSHGFEVTTANGGEEGIHRFKDEQPDVIILDLMMPGVDGQEVCRRIRASSNVPIIILSALNSPDTIAKALDAGADDYLIKPVPSSVLIAHIKALVRRTGRLRGDAVAERMMTR